MKTQRESTRTALRSVSLYAGLHAATGIVAGMLLIFYLRDHPGAVLGELLSAIRLRPEEIHPGLLALWIREIASLRLEAVAAFSFLYAILRGIECFGLWKMRPWGEIYSAATAGIFLPLEAESILHRPGFLNTGSLLINLGILFFMLRALEKHRRA